MERINTNIYLRINGKCCSSVRPTKIRVTRKKWKHAKLLEAVRNYMAKIAITPFAAISLEEIELSLHARRSAVAKVFMELNRLGELQQKSRRFAHDTSRNNMFPGPDSGWSANYYYIINN